MVKDRSDLLGAWAFKGQAEDVETIYEGMQKEFGDKVRLDYPRSRPLPTVTMSRRGRQYYL